jgi:hypothetical protein
MKVCGKPPFGRGIRRVLASICAAAAGCLSCSDKAEVDSQPRPRASLHEGRADIRSVAALRMILVPGMTTNEILAKLGEPDREENTTRRVIWRYQLPAFPADEPMQGTHVIGVAIGLTNGHLAEWGCAYLGGPSDVTVASRQSLADAANGSHSPALRFFAVSHDPVAPGRFVDTKQLPKLGYISTQPEMTVGRLKGVTLEERKVREGDSQSRTVWVFICSLDSQFADQFKVMTTQNLAKRVLIMVGDEPVVAPTILAPVEDGRFEIECKDRSSMESVMKQLSGITGAR